MRMAMERKRIVCFGDSNTWGYDPGTAERFPEDVRWTGLLAQALGENYWVIEEGQNGRTIATDDPCEGEKNGMRSLVPCIESQKPFDLLIIMLGTNDLKRKFQYCAMDVAGEMELMAEKITNYLRFHMKGNPQVLLISPVHIGENITRSRLGDLFGYERSRQVSLELADWYRQIAEIHGFGFLDAAQFARAGQNDSVHLEADGHRALAEAVEDWVRTHLK